MVNTKVRAVVSETFLEDPGGPISVVSLSPTGKLVCAGNDDGLIEPFDVVAGLRVEIERTATGVSGRLTLIELSFDEGWKHRHVKRFKSKMQAGGISQVLFSPDTKSVLVVFHGSAQLWSLESGLLEHTYPEDMPSMSSWVYTNTSQRGATHEIIDMKPPSFAGSIEQNSSEDVHKEIEQVRETHLPGYVLIMISRRSATGPLDSRFEMLNTTKFDHMFADTQHVLLLAARAVNIPSEIAAEVEIPLDILPNKRLVFVDQSLGLCTWHLHSSGGVEDIARHFFIPRNWLPDRNIDLLRIGPAGTLF